MQKVLTVCILITLHLTTVQAQQQEGTVVYEQTMRGGKAMMHVNGESREIDRPAIVHKVEVLFGNKQSLRKTLEEERPEAEMAGGGGNVGRFAVGGPGQGTVYNHYTENRMIEQREDFGQRFLISGAPEKLSWKLTGESKTILGIACQQAVATNIGKTFRMSVENGEMKRVEVPDTSKIIAWFAPSIPVPAGPEYTGQLPGLILELDTKDGRMTYTAVELSPKVNIAAIKEPKGGKKLTREEYKKESEEAMKTMERGPMRTMRRG